MKDEQAIENEIQAKGLTAPRLTPQHIDAQIYAENAFRVSDALEAIGHPVSEAHKCLTICVIVLRNGFTVVGESACASPENYDAELGYKIARENARNKIWPLEGYLLKTKLANG